MAREEKARIDCLVEDRGTLVDAISFLFNEDYKKISKMNSLKLVKKLERAHLSCDEIIDDLIEDGFDIVSLPNDYGELLMIYYGAALRFSAHKVNVKKEKKAGKRERKSGVCAQLFEIVKTSPHVTHYKQAADEAGIKRSTTNTFLNRCKREDEQSLIAKKHGVKITVGADYRLYFTAL